MNKRGWVIDCCDAHGLLSQSMDRDLPLGDRIRLRVHVGICRMCARVSRQLGLIRVATRRLGGS